jgi:hypothetical protein
MSAETTMEIYRCEFTVCKHNFEGVCLVCKKDCYGVTE